MDVVVIDFVLGGSLESAFWPTTSGGHLLLLASLAEERVLAAGVAVFGFKDLELSLDLGEGGGDEDISSLSLSLSLFQAN